MKHLFFLLCAFSAFHGFAQVAKAPIDKNNFFVAAELGKPIGYSYKRYGVSVAYNRLLSSSKFGVGVGLEIMDIRMKEMGGLMPSLDLRYYSRFGKSTIMPFAQVGYNFYNFQTGKVGDPNYYRLQGGLGYAVGVGYSYALTPKGKGIYGALKIGSDPYRYVNYLSNGKGYNTQATFSIGWRF